MPMAWPVTPAEASEARKTISPATSSAVPKALARRTTDGTGRPCSISSTYGAKAGMVSVIAVAAIGTTALTVTPARASSIAQVRAIATMPALAAA